MSVPSWSRDHSFCERTEAHLKNRIEYLEKELQALKEAYWSLDEAQSAIYSLAEALKPFLKEEIQNVCKEQQDCKGSKTCGTSEPSA